MTPLDLKKAQVEYKRVNAAREEQELRILDFHEQIARIQQSIDLSIAKEEEILGRIEDIKKQLV